MDRRKSHTDWDLVERLWWAQTPVDTIAMVVGLKTPTIRSECSRRFGRRSGSPPVNSAQIEEMRQMYAGDLSVEEIATHFGVTNATVQNYRRRGGWPHRCPPWTEERKQQAATLYQAGKSLNDIATLLQTNPRRVSEALESLGLARRGKGSSGVSNPAWRGGRVQDKHGYILVKVENHPRANHQGYVREHRLVMESVLGRYLLPTEVVHHRNGDRADNRPENLELFATNGEHLQHELTGRCPQWTEEGRARILHAVRSRRLQSSIRDPSRSGEPGSL